MTATRSETGYTPGPWALRFSHDGSGDVGIIAPGLKNVLAECFSSMRSHDERAEAEAKANAYLIIAAPDLLSALQAVVADIRDYERVNNLSPNPGRKDCWDSVTRADAAISKATGAQS